MKKVTCKEFCATLLSGIWQAIKWVIGLFGYKEDCKYAKVVRHIFATCLTILLVFFTSAIVYAFAKEVVYKKWIRPQAEESYWDDKSLSNNLVYQISWNTEQGRIYDEKQQKVVLDEVDWVYTSSDYDSLAVFARHCKRGYINRFTGEVVIPEAYSRAWVFSEGLAAVEKDGELVFIDHSGNVVIDEDFEVHFSESPYTFEHGYCVLHDLVTGKLGLIDRKGEWVLSPEYDKIFNDNGFWQVEKNDRVGLYTADLDMMFPLENIEISVFNSFIEVRHANHIAKQYDFDGNVVVDFVIDNVYNLTYVTTELRNDLDVSTDEYVDKNVYGVANCQCYSVYSGMDFYYRGLLNRNGEVITQPIYTEIQAISKNRYLCQPQGIIIDDNGEEVGN